MKSYIRYVILLLSFQTIYLHLSAQTISTVVGNGNAGYAGDGGLATLSEIALTKETIIDNHGNLLICNSNAVRHLDLPTGIITTVAGSDTASSLGGGGNGGPATNALLVSPYGVCVDNHDNLYIADYWTNRVRKVDAMTGIIDIYAGSTNGNSGDGGPATSAKFGAGVTAVCIDTVRKYLYISDGWNYRVRKVDMATGIITAFAGTGTNGLDGDGGLATAAKFSRVFGLAIDKAGNVYIGDWDNHRIRKVDIESGIVTTIAGNGMDGYSGDGGPATAAMLRKPTAICFDTCGNLYFSDEENNRVRKIDVATGMIKTVAGNGTAGFSGDGGPALDAQFNHPTGVCIDKDFNLFVGDYYNHRVRKVALGNCENTGTSVNDIVEEQQIFSIYPNPATTHLTITSGTPINSVGITNRVGQLLDKITMTKGLNKAEINISHLLPGMYLVKVNGVWVQRFMKQ